MKGEKTLWLLNFVKELAQDNLDFLEAFLTSGKSSRRFQQKLNQLDRQRAFRNFNLDPNNKKHQRNLKLLIVKLRKDGLLSENRTGGKSFLTLTGQGEEKLKKLKTNFLPPTRQYLKQSSGKYYIVIFDIPESAKRKRYWLRQVLRNLNFELVQKSVWSGKSKLPKELINDFYLGIADYIEIFEVKRFGSLSAVA